MTTPLQRLDAIIAKHASTPDSGIGAMDRMAFLSLANKLTNASEEDTNAALAAYLDTMSKRTLASDLLDDLIALGTTIPGAPSFQRDYKAEAIAASHAMIRSKFNTQGMALPDADPEDAPEAAEGEDGEGDGGWGEMSFGEPEAKPEPSVATVVWSVIIAGLNLAGRRSPQGMQLQELMRDLSKIQGSKEPVKDMALVLDRHTKLLAQMVPVLVNSQEFAEFVKASPLSADHQDALMSALRNAQAALAGGASTYATILSVVIEIQPD